MMEEGVERLKKVSRSLLCKLENPPEYDVPQKGPEHTPPMNHCEFWERASVSLRS
jgi:hypothetical protein